MFVIVSLGTSNTCYSYGTSKIGYEKGHNFIIKKAIDYLKAKRSHAADRPLYKYLPWLVEGSWYADHTPLDCTWGVSFPLSIVFDSKTYTCDQLHHYGEVGDIRTEASSKVANTGDFAAPYYAKVLFDQAIKFWPGGVKPSLAELPLKDGVTITLPGIEKDLGKTFVGGLPYCKAWAWVQKEFKQPPGVEAKGYCPKWPDWAAKHAQWLNDVYKIPIESRKNAMKYLGWAVHLVQDITVPQNAINFGDNSSEEFESEMEAWIKQKKFNHLPLESGKYKYDPNSSVFTTRPYADIKDLAEEARQKSIEFSNIVRTGDGGYMWGGVKGLNEKIMDLCIKLTAEAIEMYFEQLDWVQIGTPAKNLYAAGETLYATNPVTGRIYRYNGGVYPNHSWKFIAEKGADFVIHGSELYRLSIDKTKVDLIQYEADPYEEFKGAWKATKIRGATGRIYGGSFGLFATDSDKTDGNGQQVTGDIYQYSGKPPNVAWKRIGGPGKMFAVGKHHLYGLSPSKGGVNRFDGKDWEPLGKPNGDLAIVDWCYSLPTAGLADKINFSLIIKNVGRFVWNTTEEGISSITIAYDDGKIERTYHPTSKLNPVGLNPGESIIIGGDKLPFSSTWNYFIGPLRIVHSKDRNDTNNEFVPATDVRVSGIKGERFELGRDASLIKKRCKAHWETKAKLN